LSKAARRRVLVEGVSPQVDGGRYRATRIQGDRVVVSCDLVSDGHDLVAGELRYRQCEARVPDEASRDTASDAWSVVPLRSLGNDRHEASFVASELGVWEFVVEAWVDRFATWTSGTKKKLAAGQDVELDLAAGALLLRAAAERAKTDDASAVLMSGAAALERGADAAAARFAAATTDVVVRAASRHADRADATQSIAYPVLVDPPRARFSAWYEMFPRSTGEPGRHGTLRDCAKRLDYVAQLGFDVVYLPPIHPIGRAFRKGPNNTLDAGPNDVGSPWAIGASEGGHKAVHPSLGTLDDMRAFVAEARSKGVEVAIDIALQASPDHPYVATHPEWFKHRPDGTIQYAENPPKKYQDVYPFDFECEAWESLWQELASIFLFWCEQGVRIFRVDNPHTKPIRFWEWCLAAVKQRHPDVVFLAEAFTRPKLMYALAKSGFTQSYTYFTWRQTREELTRYVEELTRTPVVEFFRPNFWPNTPDILPEHLQFGGRAAFVQRLVLAATLSSNYGIYGPSFELMEHVAREGSEEYVDSEKFQLRTWDLGRDDSLRDTLALVNRIRRDTPALQHDLVTFHPTDDDQLLAFSKRSPDGESVALMVVNLDVHHTRSGRVSLDPKALGIEPNEAFQVDDVLADARHRWQGDQAFVQLDPDVLPASIFVIRKRVRTEHDFDYFL
jgi:starch synthase (maltosyl-transferring)